MSDSTRAPPHSKAEVVAFTTDVPKEQLDDLLRLLASARWPERETVQDFSQGLQLARLIRLADYWQTARQHHGSGNQAIEAGVRRKGDQFARTGEDAVGFDDGFDLAAKPGGRSLSAGRGAHGMTP
jgi:hypothetical protein